MGGRKVWSAVAMAGMAAALLSASAPDEGTGETERCPPAVSGNEFEDKPQSNIEDVEIGLMNPEIEIASYQAWTSWWPRVSNDSGADLSEAVLEIAVDQPSGCKLPIAVSNEPDECDVSEEEEPGCTAREKAAEDCEYTKAAEEAGVGSGARAVCGKDVPTGDHEFTLSLGMPGYEGPQDFSRIADYPDVAVHTRLTVDDEVVAAASSPVTITSDPFDRVDLEGIPAELSSKDENVYDWVSLSPTTPPRIWKTAICGSKRPMAPIVGWSC